jgi:hypothetical protein
VRYRGPELGTLLDRIMPSAFYFGVRLDQHAGMLVAVRLDGRLLGLKAKA